MGSDYEKQGTAYDPHAVGYERQGRERAPRRERRWNTEKQKWEYPAVHHLDGNPHNNDAANLRIVWPSNRDESAKPLWPPTQKGSKK